MTQDLDIVHLAVSRKGAMMLEEVLGNAVLNDDWPEEHNVFYESVLEEIKDQLPSKPKPKTKKPSRYGKPKKKYPRER